MNKKGIIFSLVIVLSLLLVTAMILPTSVLAKDQRPPTSPKRLDLTLTPQLIDPPVISGAAWPQANPPGANSWPIVDMVNDEPTTVGWIVKSRTISGTVSGDAAGDFTFTYGGVLDTLQSGSIYGIVVITTAKGTVYLLANGTSEATIKATYTFEEIKVWCQALETPIPIGVFFAIFYGNPGLAGVGEDELKMAYGTVLPLLPKTLADSFKGTVTVESGTGNYAAIHGTARFNPAASVPLTLSVYPNQHVYHISGAIVMRGFSSIERARLPQVVTGRVKDAIQNWLKDRKK